MYRRSRGNHLMDSSTVSAIAGLVGAATGGLTSLLASWLTQRTQARASWLGHEIVRRQDLYKEFIEDAAKCYVHALQPGQRPREIGPDAARVHARGRRDGH